VGYLRGRVIMVEYLLFGLIVVLAVVFWTVPEVLAWIVSDVIDRVKRLFKNDRQ